MSDIFVKDSNRNISRVALGAAGGQAFPAVLTIKGLSEEVILVGTSYNQAGNFNLSRSLGKTHYLYVFGDKPGDLRVNGICFRGGCKGDGDTLAEVLDFYAKNKISNLTDGSPPSVDVFLGKKLIRGVMHECSVQSGDPTYGTLNFSLSLKSLDA